MGASQCTVNNFTFGSARYQYYETISGGSGAGPVFDALEVAGIDLRYHPGLSAPVGDVIELLDAIADLDPDALTPRDALEQLYQLKRLAAA